MNHSVPSQDELIDLLVKQAVEGLSPEEAAELEQAAAAGSPAHGQAQDELRRFEQAAAAVAMARLDGQPLPATLRERLLRSVPAPPAGEPVKIAGEPPVAVRVPAASRAAANSGWWAAAACLVLALFLAGRTPRPVAAPDTGQLRTALLARAGAMKLAWSATPDPGGRGVSGDVVWDPASQRGVMRFVGLGPNDPGAHQYQLWIFDAERDERYPVDGGVFDVPAGAHEVLIPIRASLPVRQLKLLAVTIEKPGGVVVSQREHIVVTAAPTAAPG